MKLFKAHSLVVHVFLLVGLSCYFSCAVKAQEVSSKIANDQKPKLLFLNYNISKTDNGKTEVTFINKIVTDGRLKDTSNKKSLFANGDILCIQYDKMNVVLESTYTQNPLKPIVEYVNDDGELEKRQLDLETAQFSLKLQLNEKTTTIRLFFMDASGLATTELITTSIL